MLIISSCFLYLVLFCLFLVSHINGYVDSGMVLECVWTREYGKGGRREENELIILVWILHGRREG